MAKKMKLGIFLLAVLLQFSLCAMAQQTLGGITGTVSDKSGSVLPDTTVTIVGDQTTLTRIQKTNGNGAYDFVNLPIGTYTVTVTHEGFETQKLPSILVQADRTATLNVAMKVGQVGTTVEVQATPAMNAVDTTNGYILEKEQIDEVPLPTGSFTGLAILSPGVNAELPSGTGANAGLGNQPIWANGQRDTSNTFLLNGVDASNLFNGKSTSSVASARIVNNTGVSGAGSTTAEEIQSTASPYLAIGQALPTPAPETVQEFRVNTSMYDAQQGSTSGAHIDLSTASGTNSDSRHGLYSPRNRRAQRRPLFIQTGRQHPQPARMSPSCTATRQADRWAERSSKTSSSALCQLPAHSRFRPGNWNLSRTAVPFGLSDDRSAATLANVVNQNFRYNTSNNTPCGNPPNNPTPCLTAAGVDGVALQLLNTNCPTVSTCSRRRTLISPQPLTSRKMFSSRSPRIS